MGTLIVFWRVIDLFLGKNNLLRKVRRGNIFVQSWLAGLND